MTRTQTGNTPHPAPNRFAAAWLLASLLSATTVTAGDWPQILGEQRNGFAQGEKLSESWPTTGPRVAWSRPIGTGFSGVAVAAGRVFVFDRQGDKERVTAVAADTGKQLWQSGFQANFVPAYVNDNGPRCVPTVHQNRVVVFGAQGGLHCLDTKTGKTIWSHDTMALFNSKRSFRGEPPEGYFGKGSSPVIFGGLVIVNAGGAEKNAGVVAFSLADGKLAWKSTDVRASYSSPTVARIGGKTQVIFAARLNVISVDPKTGKELFRFPFGRTGPNVTGASPVVLGDQVFVTASYGFGAVMAKIDGGKIQESWRSDDILSSQYTTAIADAGKLYGIHGRQDVGGAALRCVDAASGKVAWEEPGFGYATLIAADGKLLILKTDGTLVLSRLSPTRYQSMATAKVLTGTARALPALANGRLYVHNSRSLKCLQVGRAAQ
ncbi:MAG TPA: alcohol dehydrogenase [Planctomycetaceae bacterium]|nr:alcohol dehydrogenase [Planctomycetaceae bacterium]